MGVYRRHWKALRESDVGNAFHEDNIIKALRLENYVTSTTSFREDDVIKRLCREDDANTGTGFLEDDIMTRLHCEDHVESIKFSARMMSSQDFIMKNRAMLATDICENGVIKRLRRTMPTSNNYFLVRILPRQQQHFSRKWLLARTRPHQHKTWCSSKNGAMSTHFYKITTHEKPTTSSPSRDGVSLWIEAVLPRDL